MSRTLSHRAATASALLACLATPAIAAAAPGTSRGPSTTVDPYVLPVGNGVSTTSLLTVGDQPASNGYRLVGIPDGLGAFRDGGRSFRLLANHELRQDRGKVRRHGQKGAFVSEFEIDRRSLEVRSGRDFIDPGVTYFDYVSQTFGLSPSAGGANPRDPGAVDIFPAQLAAFGRFCSSTLSEDGQLFNRRSGRGYNGRMYFANEENGTEGRLFGVTEDGEAQQLPRLGLFSWENTKPALNTGDRTVVAGLEDGGEAQVWIYTGRKRASGNAFSRAGLTRGVNHVIDVDDQTVTTDAEFRAKFGKGNPAPVDINEVDWDQSGAAQNAEAKADGLSLNRIEDGVWDPRNPDDLYFVTTEGGAGATPTRDGGGLWRLRFEDAEHPEDGATLTLLLDGSEAPFLIKPDNVDMDGEGNLLIQEDPGANPALARIIAYRVSDGARGVLAQFDRKLFGPKTAGGTDAKLTTDEESSGIIDATGILGQGWFLFDAQVHTPLASPDDELVEPGQLLALRVEDFGRVYRNR